jgi:hypothetical protein
LVGNDYRNAFCARKFSQQCTKLHKLGTSLGHGRGAAPSTLLLELSAVIGSNGVQYDKAHAMLLYCHG